MNLAKEYLTAVRDAIKPAFVQHSRQMLKEDIQVWAFALRFHQVEPKDAAAAILYWLATSRFFPQPIDIAELAKGESAANRGLRALNTLRSLVRAVGPYYTPASVDKEDPVLATTIEDMGGWRVVCEEFSDDDFYRGRFLKAYTNNQKATISLPDANQMSLLMDEDSGTLSLGMGKS